MSNGGSRAIPVTQDDVEEAGKLEEMIEALVSLQRAPRELQITEGSQVGTPVIRSEQRLGINFERVDYPVRGVLIHKKSAQGAVRFFGKDKDDNVVTDPKEQGYALIWLEDGEHCRILGTPTIQLFQKR
jgi:hypothetical protein